MQTINKENNMQETTQQYREEMIASIQNLSVKDDFSSILSEIKSLLESCKASANFKGLSDFLLKEPYPFCTTGFVDGSRGRRPRCSDVKIELFKDLEGHFLERKNKLLALITLIKSKQNFEQIHLKNGQKSLVKMGTG